MDNPQESIQAVAADALSLENQQPRRDVKKVIIAVHGIGDQFNYATIQTVAHRFCGYFDAPAAIPLGNFHSKRLGEQGPLLLESPPYNPPLSDIGFAEAYWADVPREPAKEGHTIEESKKWARTIVERIRLRSGSNAGGLSEQDALKIKTVLEEMIETLAVLDRLVFIAEKAGLFKFDLEKLLVDYLGDVQIVTEFKNYRGKILKQFFDVMKAVNKDFPNAEIYVVAHSEGTVVSFLGLLEAMCRYSPGASDWKWIEKVRGYMTIGSPIDKHLILWPELWKEFEQCPNRPALKTPIKWRNFYDYGDPIGFKLNSARDWLRKHKWNVAFEFDEKDHDIGYSRYYFPGKAHNDYWGDEDLFGHFIHTVVGEPVTTSKKKPKDFSKPPRSKFWPRVMSLIAPYSIVAVLLFVAVYVIYKAIGTAVPPLPPLEPEKARDVFMSTAGLTCLLAGITLVARIPRLTLSVFSHLAGFGFFALFTFVYYVLITHSINDKLLISPQSHERINEFPSIVGKLLSSHTGIAIGIDATIVFAVVVAIVVYLLNRLFPKWGLYTLLIPGFLAVTGMVVYRTASAKEHGPIWPVVLALAAFLYLWWLAALIFDLVYVWHRYIRRSVALDRLRNLSAMKGRDHGERHNL